MKFQSNCAPERARVSQRVAKRASGSQCESCKEGQWKPECELQKAIESQYRARERHTVGQLELER